MGKVCGSCRISDFSIGPNSNHRWQPDRTCVPPGLLVDPVVLSELIFVRSPCCRVLMWAGEGIRWRRELALRGTREILAFGVCGS